MEKYQILVLNGPNLNMLGKREPEVYGRETLADIEDKSLKKAQELGVGLDFRQSNSEGELISWLQQSSEAKHGVIINPAGLTHTSVALMDALILTGLPIIEVHLSNIHKREKFRHISYVSKISDGIICGLGSDGYLFAISALVNILKRNLR